MAEPLHLPTPRPEPKPDLDDLIYACSDAPAVSQR